MIGLGAADRIGDDGRVDRCLSARCADGGGGRGDAVDRRALHLDLGCRASARQPGKDAANISVDIARIAGGRELRLRALPADRHRARTVLHRVTLWHGEGDAAGRVQEIAPVDHALRRIVAIHHAVDRGQERIAVAGAGRAGGRGLIGGALDARCGVGMGARPFGQGSCIARQPLVEAVLRGQAFEHGGERRRVIACAHQILDAQIVRLRFLPARIAERRQLRAGADAAPEQTRQPRIAADRADDRLSQRAEYRVALGDRLALLAVARRDMRDLVAQHRGQFGLVVHQRDELARRIDIAAGDREGVVHRAVEQGHVERVGIRRKPRLHRRAPPDPLDIGGLRPGISTAKFGDQPGICLRALLALRCGDRRRLSGGQRRGIGHSHCTARERKRCCREQPDILGHPDSSLIDWRTRGGRIGSVTISGLRGTTLVGKASAPEMADRRTATTQQRSMPARRYPSNYGPTRPAHSPTIPASSSRAKIRR